MVIDLTNSDRYYWFDDQGTSEFQYDTDPVFHRKVRLCLLCVCFTAAHVDTTWAAKCGLFLHSERKLQCRSSAEGMGRHQTPQQ